jgi:hypothetical protein
MGIFLRAGIVVMIDFHDFGGGCIAKISRAQITPTQVLARLIR